GDVPALLAVADAMEARSLSFDAALQALATLVHRIALAQYAPEAIGDEVERARILGYVERFDAEFLQLAYQIAIHGRDELPLAPDEYTGFTMTLLRLHAFRPEQPAALGGPGVQPGPAGRAREIGAGQGTFVGKPAPTGEGAEVRATVAAKAAPSPGPSPSARAASWPAPAPTATAEPSRASTPAPEFSPTPESSPASTPTASSKPSASP